MSVPKTNVSETNGDGQGDPQGYPDFLNAPPIYQLEMIEWLKNYEHTELLQDLMRKCLYYEQEVEKFKRGWSKWLKPKKVLWRVIH